MWRFNLRTLCVVVAIIQVMLATYVTYGHYSLYILTAHAIFFSAGYACWHWKANQWAWSIAILYASCWILTQIWGGYQIHADLELKIIALLDERVESYRKLEFESKIVQFGFDDDIVLPKPAWYMVGTPIALAPFVIQIDCAYLSTEQIGRGASVFYWWLFGYQVWIGSPMWWLK